MGYWSGFYLGQEDDDVRFVQTMIGQPETGVWGMHDEDAYLDCIEVAAERWEVLCSFFPKNWFHMFDRTP